MTIAIITGDLHLTSSPADEYRWAVFDKIRKYADSERASLILLCGDITDRKDKHDAVLVNRLMESLLGLVDMGGKSMNRYVVWLRGNHDCVDPENPFFGFISKLKNSNVLYVNEPTYFQRWRLLALPHTKNPLKDWKQLKTQFRSARLVAMHQTFRGAVTSNGQKLDGFPAAFLRKWTNAKLVSGDIHVPQVCGPVTYAGAPHPVRFGDVYYPRLLMLSRKGGIKSIPCTTIQKLSVNIRAAKDIDAVELHPGDQIKVAVTLPRAELYTWGEVRRDIEHAIKKTGAILYGCSVSAEDATPATSSKRVRLKPSLTRDPSSMLASYVKERGIDISDEMLVVGQKLVTECASKLSLFRGQSGEYVPQNLTVQGFRSFGVEQTFEFPKGEGLWLMSGQNRVQKRLGANGAGKSSFWAALCFVLFGKTDRGVRGPTLVNWTGEHLCSVTHEFQKGALTYKLARTQDPNTLTLSTAGGAPEVKTQEQIDEILGMRWESFLFMGLMGQFGSFFFDLGPSKMLELFSSALELDVFESAASASDELAKAYAQKIHAKETHLTGTRSRIVQLKETIADQRKQQLRWKRGLSAKKMDLVKQKEKLEEKLQAAQKGTEITDKKVRALKARYARQARTTQRLLLDRESLTNYVAGEAAQIHRLQQEGLVFGLGKCSSCLQKIGKTHAKKCSSTIQKKITALRKREVKHTAELAALEKKLEKAKKTEEIIARKKSHLEARLGSRGMRRAVVKERIAGIEKELQEVNGEHDPFSLLLKQTTGKLEQERQSRATMKTQLDGTRQSHDTCEFWATQLKDVRLWLVHEAQLELEVQTNNALLSLGLEGWKVRFDVERTTKSGSVSRGFQVFIQSPDSPEETPWDSWCGGETQRLRVAGAKGMSELMQSRLGVRVALQAWDEPTTHLSTEGIEDLLQTLGAWAEEGKRQIWVIDHHSLPAGAFRGEVRVTRKDNGSVLRLVHRQDGE